MLNLVIRQNRCVPFNAARSVHIQASRLILKEYGDPAKVVEKEDFDIDTNILGPKDVLVKMLLSPINPADINTIQGVYAVKPKLPFTLGNEGVGVVEQVGSGVKEFSVKDYVIPSINAWGTWRSHAVDSTQNLIKLPNDITPVVGATIAVNPCTAYRMLHDFVSLKKGDYVIQNGANSAVGQSVIQICRHLGVRTINVVRNRENIGELKRQLTEMGADFVLTDEELRTAKDGIPAANLALNCVGGKSVVDLIKNMANDAVLVTYGGMSRQPLLVPTAPLIFKNIQLAGFWMTRWNWQHQDETGFNKRTNMINELCDMAREGSLRPPPHELVGLSNFKEALAQASDPAGLKNRKLIFAFE